ncbi:MAG: aminomethyl transferase family protein [Dehalobacterium sp.]
MSEKQLSFVSDKYALSHSPVIPFDEKVGFYVTMPWRNYAIPYEFTGWRDEQMSWKETAYISAGLNPSPTYVFKGPEAFKFISENLTNGIEKLEIGGARHGVMCNEDGILVSDGLLLRTGEDEFLTHWLAPYIAYRLETGGYDAIGKYLTGKVYFFQVAGPRSLEILEAASGDNLHNIEFMHHRMSNINGKPCRILRVGMAGTLAYEVHGDLEDAHEVYNAIFTAGKPFGIRKLGYHTYLMNHTEDGFPQAYYHFPYAWEDDKGFQQYMKEKGTKQGAKPLLRGSMGPDIKLRYRNPVEHGWEKTINFNHDFRGKEALEKLAAKPNKKMVTLVWNKEDIFDVYRSQFELGEPYLNMDEPYHFLYHYGNQELWADQVLNEEGKLIGCSSGRAYSYKYREMLSLCPIDVEYSELGTEVTVVWGEAGTRQKKIKAVVSRFPYLNENRNENIDVNIIPYQK